MSISLHAAIVPTQLQMLGAMLALIEKAQGWCAEQGVAEAELLDRRIAPDMYSLAYQFKSIAVHSLGAIEGVRAGHFSPDTSTLPDSFAPLAARLRAAQDALATIDPAEMEGFIGRDMMFVIGERQIGFEAQDFLLSFSQPNFYFHCTTAYAILRGAGMPIGKVDFLGRPRRKAA